MDKTKISRIVILPGSFNPPTKAHTDLLQTAMKAYQADLGLFMPTTQEYVSRKMARQKDTLLFTGQERLDMLEAMCDESSDNMDITLTEYHYPYINHTIHAIFETMKEYPNTKIVVIVGDDKLHTLPKWRGIENLLTHCNILITCRETTNVMQQVANNPILAPYQNKFIELILPSTMTNISSSKFRHYMNNHQYHMAANIVTPAVWNYIQNTKMRPN